MCGINGFNWENKTLIKQMNRSIRHRGPDYSNIYIDEGISLGHNRLAIIDLSKKGNQPMHYKHKDKEAVIIYNGELFNFKEIKKNLQKKGYRFDSNTDTEVIIAAYFEYGYDCVKHFNGMWAFCIYDINKKVIFCSRDRLGIKPFYYHNKGNEFIFSSEIKSILNYTKPKINHIMFNRYIAYRYCFGKDTIFSDIEKLLPAHNLIYDLKTKKLELHKYWTNKKNKAMLNQKDAQNQLLSLLKDSIKKRLISDVPLGVFLSGGIDSSTIVALMREINKKSEIKSYSIGFEQGEKVNELKYAKIIADKFNTTHKEFVIGKNSYKILDKVIHHCDEPMADPALIPLYHLSSNASKEVKVVLTGDGGDEFFAGYDHHRILMQASKLAKIPFSDKLVNATIKAMPNSFLNKIYKHADMIGKDNVRKRIYQLLHNLKKNNNFEAYEQLLAIFNQDERKHLINSRYYKQDMNLKSERPDLFKSKDNLKNILEYDQNIMLPDSFLMKTDKITMAHSLEARVPLLDYRIAEFSNQIPNSLKLKNNIGKYILRKTMNNKLPYDLLWRSKQTFHVPIEEWINDGLLDQLDKELKEISLKQLNYNYVDNIKKKYKKGKLFYAKQLWNLITFAKWHKQFIQ